MAKRNVEKSKPEKDWGRFSLSPWQITSVIFGAVGAAIGGLGNVDTACSLVGADPGNCGSVSAVNFLFSQSGWLVPSLIYVAVVMFVWGERKRNEGRYSTTKAVSDNEGRIALAEEHIRSHDAKIASVEEANSKHRQKLSEQQVRHIKQARAQLENVEERAKRAPHDAQKSLNGRILKIERGLAAIETNVTDNRIKVEKDAAQYRNDIDQKLEETLSGPRQMLTEHGETYSEMQSRIAHVEMALQELKASLEEEESDAEES
ncbi:MAG: hypothetical protein HKN78_00320 [Sphingomonadaceae bacterium]|nr:hypothetical protein [Sphingomonadaceae bacterium]